MKKITFIASMFMLIAGASFAEVKSEMNVADYSNNGGGNPIVAGGNIGNITQA